MGIKIFINILKYLDVGLNEGNSVCSDGIVDFRPQRCIIANPVHKP